MTETDPSAPILIFDSGVGGLSVLGEVRKLLPDAPVIYAADTAGLPYGTKSEAEIAARVAGLLGRMSALADAGIPFDVILAPNAWGLGDPASVAARCAAYPTIIRDERTPPPAPAWRSANPDVWVLPRIKPGALPVVHLLNRAYDQAIDRFAPQRNVAITLAPELAAGCTTARLHRPEGDSLDAPVKKTAAGLRQKTFWS